MNKALKEALEEHPEKNYEVAKKVGLYHTALSKIIAEIQTPTEKQKVKLAEVLDRDVNEIFPE